MSTFVEKVRAELLAASPLTNLVGERIYPVKAPQAAVAPFVVLTVVSDVPEDSFTSTTDEALRSARMQVDSYAIGYLDAHAVAKAVKNVVGNLARSDLCGLYLTARDLYDDETELRRVSADFSVWAGE